MKRWRRNDRAVPRGPRRHMAGSPGSARRQRGAPAGKRRAHRWQAREERGVHSACALTLADLESTKSIVYLSFRTGPKRLPRPASWESPPPKAFPALGIHPASGSTSFLFGKRCPMGHNAVSFQDYRGQFRVRKPKSHKIRSTPKIQRSVLVLSTPSRQGVPCKSFGLDRTQTVFPARKVRKVR